jgi:hypothetical protein
MGRAPGCDSCLIHGCFQYSQRILLDLFQLIENGVLFFAHSSSNCLSK